MHVTFFTRYTIIFGYIFLQIHIDFLPTYPDGTKISIPVIGIYLPASQSLFFEGVAAGGVDAFWKLDPLNKTSFLVFHVKQLTNDICGSINVVNMKYIRYYYIITNSFIINSFIVFIEVIDHNYLYVGTCMHCDDIKI